MSQGHIWRYMSLAKYVDLLRSRAIFCPKASLFEDETEGKWIAHAVLRGQKERRSRTRRNAERLQQLLDECAGDQDRILRTASDIYRNLNTDERKSAFGSILARVARIFPHKREEYLRETVSSWLKLYEDHNQSLQQWTHEVSVHRESTYISCWNRADSMSLAMWKLYGGGTESIAIRSNVDKLRALLANNLDRLQKEGFDGEVIDVAYVEGLKDPDENLQADLLDRLTLGKGVRTGTFSVKPSMYSYENEVRVIVYPVQDFFSPVVDPHPHLRGISLVIGGDNATDALSAFIESVYLHPMLDVDSMMVRVVKAIHERFGLADLPVITDKVEAIGPDMALQPIGHVVEKP